MRSPALGPTTQSRSFGDLSVKPRSPMPETSRANDDETPPANDDAPNEIRRVLPNQSTQPATIQTPSIAETSQSKHQILHDSPSSNHSSIEAKPDTPPKKDFRSGLKARPQSGDNQAKEEPEFKNVFGKLKKTQTQNYVAPDELKSNIVRGKAGLATTGGPKKSEIRDDFKDSILRKKSAMVTPSASTRITSASQMNSKPGVPEAIAKRQDMARPGSLVKDKTSPVVPADSSSTLSRKPGPPDPRPPEATPQQGSNFASNLASVLQRGPAPLATKVAKDGDGSLSKAEDSSKISPQQLNHATKSRARGPKRRPPSTAAEAVATTPSSITSPTKVPQNGITSRTLARTPDSPAKVEEASFTSPAGTDLSLSMAKPSITNTKPANFQPMTPRKPSTSIANRLDGEAGKP